MPRCSYRAVLKAVAPIQDTRKEAGAILVAVGGINADEWQLGKTKVRLQPG